VLYSACRDDLSERLAVKSLEAMGIGAAKAKSYAQKTIDHRGSLSPQPGTLIVALRVSLRTDDHVGARIEKTDRTMVKECIPEIYFVADDVLACRALDASAQRQSVVWLGRVEHTDP
jgi:hypothetical protein